MARVSEWIAEDTAALRKKGLLRELEPLVEATGPQVLVGGRLLHNFSSNDYLGLAAHPRVIAAAKQCVDVFGVGTGASRLVTGDTVVHHSLETALAALKGMPSVTLFNSGYAANCGAIGALVGEGDLVLSDALNHASLIDACRLSRADVRVYRHADASHAAWILQKARGHRRKLLVTDSVFSMDGDCAPLAALRLACDAASAGLYVDEAHGTGVLGATGAGLCEQLGVKADIVMGTLSKALGSAGAFVAGPNDLQSVLISKARSLIFSTAFPAALAAAALEALTVMAEEPQRRVRLHQHMLLLSERLSAVGFEGLGQSPIFSLILGEPAKALAASAMLREAGFLVKAIRPPTVPSHSSRLRVTLSAAHSEAQVQFLAESLQRLLGGAVSTGHTTLQVAADEAKMKRDELSRLDQAHVWHPFTQMQVWDSDGPLMIERSEGNWLIDVNGKAYLDGISSLWTTVHGHRHVTINNAIVRQLNQVAHSTLLGQASPPSVALAERLVRIAPPGLTHVFYSDSGSTAVEIAVKMAYQYWQLTGHPRKQRFVALAEAYHGDTIGSVSVGGMELFHERFRQLLFPVERIPTPHTYRWQGHDALGESIEALESVLSQGADSIAGLIIEPLVQGAAGMLMQPKGYLKAVETLCRRYQVLLIADEVATGFGRTGKMFAVEHEGVTPDLMCMAKGLSGGYLPLAATMASESVYQAFLGRFDELKTFFHGHTYTGNPLACAAALANLQVFEQEKTLRHVERLSAYLSDRLKVLAGLPNVGDIRQCGLMIGIELVRDKVSKTPYAFEKRIGFAVCQAARKHQVLLRPLGNVVVLMPPLSLSIEEADVLIDAVKMAIGEVTCHVV
jgi:adenosylmethionine---8-amino-7-oxononanoate aminotransferase